MTWREIVVSGLVPGTMFVFGVAAAVNGNPLGLTMSAMAIAMGRMAAARASARRRLDELNRIGQPSTSAAPFRAPARPGEAPEAREPLPAARDPHWLAVHDLFEQVSFRTTIAIAFSTFAIVWTLLGLLGLAVGSTAAIAAELPRHRVFGAVVAVASAVALTRAVRELRDLARFSVSGDPDRPLRHSFQLTPGAPPTNSGAPKPAPPSPSPDGQRLGAPSSTRRHTVDRGADNEGVGADAMSPIRTPRWFR